MLVAHAVHQHLGKQHNLWVLLARFLIHLRRLRNPSRLVNHFEELNLVPCGKFSEFLFRIQPGDCVEMTGPWGNFIFREPVQDSILVAAGTGVVPFRAMLLDRLARDSKHHFTLLFGARYQRKLLYAEEFEALAARYSNFSFWPTLSRPEPGWAGRVGHVQKHLFEAIGDRREIKVFICGLEEMVDDVRAILKAHGLDRKQIAYEKYD